MATSTAPGASIPNMSEKHYRWCIAAYDIPHGACSAVWLPHARSRPAERNDPEQADVTPGTAVRPGQVKRSTTGWDYLEISDDQSSECSGSPSSCTEEPASGGPSAGNVNHGPADQYKVDQALKIRNINALIDIGPPESTVEAPAEQDNASTTATTTQGSGDESCAARQCALDADEPRTFVRAYVGAPPPRLARQRPDRSPEGIDLLETMADVSYEVRDLRQENAKIRTMCDELRQDFATLHEHMKARNNIRAAKHGEHRSGGAAASGTAFDNGAQTDIPATSDPSAPRKEGLPETYFVSKAVREVRDNSVIAPATLRDASAVCVQDRCDMAIRDDISNMDISSDDPDGV
ncbi:uncharacterized protein B0H18DRAFT_1124189 [Fomitopsis serialis]|uniref:uncharacterized protein n=1 Tax=Fomitopsis serialis TaxID=139415 RepID=UPI002008D249|nr:uncharacterized protein B0H18DRAFT_1124189 [Neoantrodia serialis]KAH9916460.1 hypothetical protein B0H18DRAFT_1124189 [Neoantrodia serialis]